MGVTDKLHCTHANYQKDHRHTNTSAVGINTYFKYCTGIATDTDINAGLVFQVFLINGVFAGYIFKHISLIINTVHIQLVHHKAEQNWL